MRKALILAAMLVAAPLAASATENRPEPRAVNTEMAATSTRTEAVVTPIRAENRASADAEEMRQVGERGSFWWIVAVIVVAGVILAVVL